MKPPANKPHDIPISSLSTYKTQFLNYGPTMAIHENPPFKMTTVRDFGMNCRSSYQDNYRQQSRLEPPPSRLGLGQYGSRPPFAAAFRTDFDNTSYRVGYKPFISKPGGKRINLSQMGELTPAYEGQFETESRHAYIQPEKKKCAARSLLEHLGASSQKVRSILEIIEQRKRNRAGNKSFGG